jgi:hypothetical protein
MNPGFTLPEDQAILAARYMVARWGANAVSYFLGGDAPYRDAKAQRWRNIGRAVFNGIAHATVTVHPNGMQWTGDVFQDETWFDYVGYQSGHGDDNPTVAWLVEGPPATEWDNLRPQRPIVNLEPPYEGHVAYQSKKPFDAHETRKRLYWSLLVTPTAGVTYGGHGVWGWDDGTAPPMNHPNTGIPLPWQEALRLEAAEQVTHLVKAFGAIDWWRLLPAQELLAAQPGDADKQRFIAAARADGDDLAVFYTPHGDPVMLRKDVLRPGLSAGWHDPRTGAHSVATPTDAGEALRFQPPGEGDWLLILS